MSITYATFDPAKKSANITLSGGNLIATNSSPTWDSVLSTIGVSSGKWYWEYTCNTISSGQFAGVDVSSATLTTYIGTGATGYAYLSINGNKYNSNSPVAYGATWTTGDIMGVALDMDGGTITFYKNNVSQGQAFSGLTGTVYAGASSNSSGSQITANFGASALTYTPPSGYNAGLYTGSASNPNFLTFM